MLLSLFFRNVRFATIIPPATQAVAPPIQLTSQNGQDTLVHKAVLTATSAIANVPPIAKGMVFLPVASSPSMSLKSCACMVVDIANARMRSQMEALPVPEKMD
ncbi:hypothetical protein RRF57_007377 [Xylaria bambusicola]|uniref:Uncharacterized protein n=1 Tax=Xylaria bambusicola TaxID=326684 RepID=A0AAN7UL13_9PEZI